jgi:hypothetical protein
MKEIQISMGGTKLFFSLKLQTVKIEKADFCSSAEITNVRD